MVSQNWRVIHCLNELFYLGVINPVEGLFVTAYFTLAHLIKQKKKSSVVYICLTVQKAVLEIGEHVDIWIFYLKYGYVAQLLELFPYEGIEVVDFFKTFTFIICRQNSVKKKKNYKQIFMLMLVRYNRPFSFFYQILFYRKNYYHKDPKFK